MITSFPRRWVAATLPGQLDLLDQASTSDTELDICRQIYFDDNSGLVNVFQNETSAKSHDSGPVAGGLDPLS